MQVNDDIAEGSNEQEEPIVPMPEAFSIRDHRTANWFVRKVLDARRYAEQVKRFAEAELKRAQREEAFLLARYGEQLQQFVVHQINLNGDRRRFIALPAGRICLRRVPAWVEVADEKKLIGWCREHLPDAVVKTERLLRGAVRGHVEQTGEVPDGAELRGETQRLLIQDLAKKSSDFLEGEDRDGPEEKSSQQ